MRITKRLLISIVSLVLSLAVSVWAIFAWFTTNSRVGADDISFSVTSPDILDFNVTAYYLNNEGTESYSFVKASNGNLDGNGNALTDLSSTAIAVDKLTDGILSSSDDEMRPYGGISSEATAVLFKIDYSLKSDCGKVFKITASCPAGTPGVSSSENAFTSDLSNAVFFMTAVTASSAETPVYTASSTPSAAFLSDSTGSYIKQTKLSLFKGLDPSVSASGTVYAVMDYDSGLFSYIYSLVLRGGGNLNSSLNFSGDITIGIEAYDPSTDTDEDYAVTNVINLIKAIGTVTESSGSAISAARSAYKALTPSQQALVTNYATLTAAEDEYNQLVDSDNAAVTNVISLIDAIGTVSTSSGSAISAARSAYDALSESQKERVTNYSVLTEAEASYATLNQAAAKEVTDKIDALPAADEITADNYSQYEDAVTAARSAYNGLTESQKAYVSQDSLTKLEAVETAIGLVKGGSSSSTGESETQTVNFADYKGQESISLTVDGIYELSASKTDGNLAYDTADNSLKVESASQVVLIPQVDMTITINLGVNNNSTSYKLNDDTYDITGTTIKLDLSAGTTYTIKRVSGNFRIASIVMEYTV